MDGAGLLQHVLDRLQVDIFDGPDARFGDCFAPAGKAVGLAGAGELDGTLYGIEESLHELGLQAIASLIKVFLFLSVSGGFSNRRGISTYQGS
jgi:hypothetical protein